MFETWVGRKSNAHTQRSYRQGVLLFVRFMGFRWPDEDWRLVRDVTVPDVHRWRASMLASGAAPNTLNHHVSACSRFYDYLQAQAANFRIPILIANPFHRDFISRERAEPRRPSVDLSATNVSRRNSVLPTRNTRYSMTTIRPGTGR